MSSFSLLGNGIDLAKQTPASRDRYVDFLRAFAICVVVLGHWLIAAVYWRGGRVSGENALHVVPGLWLATWILQVMPVFFFVGGFSNLTSWDSVVRRGGGYVEFVTRRTKRLMRPTVVFLSVWLPLAVGVDLFTGVGDRVIHGASGLLTRPLWFIGIYLMVIALAPAMIRAHRRFGLKVVIAMALAAAGVDLLSVGLGVAYAGFLNFAIVWLLVHQLGFFYADATLVKHRRWVFLAMAATGLATLVGLTASGVYSSSMVGLRNERSNTNPPTIAILALTSWQVGLLMLARPRLVKWLENLRVWAAVIGLNAVIMTMFLWHQTAMLMVVGALYPLGFPQPQVGTLRWWAVRPLWLASLALVLGLLVLIFGRFERERKAKGPSALLPAQGLRAANGPFDLRRVSAVAGIVYALMAILGFAVSGFEGFALSKGELLVIFEVNPLQNSLHLLIGMALLGASAQAERAARRNIAIVSLTLASVGLAGVLLFDQVGGLNVLAVNTAGDALHIVSSLALMAGLARRRLAPA